jgi:hypothetical protein
VQTRRKLADIDFLPTILKFLWVQLHLSYNVAPPLIKDEEFVSSVVKRKILGAVALVH